MADPKVKKIPKITCDNCKEEVKVYCVECKKKFCYGCCGRLHHPFTKTETHSIEEIDKIHSGSNVLTCALMDLVVVLVIVSLLWDFRIGDDYFHGQSNCPSVARLRKLLAYLDVNAYYWFKSDLASHCDIEDSFWRLLMDTWIRSVVAGTDSWLLLLMTLWKAFTFEAFVLAILVPLVSVLYAGVATGTSWLENHVELPDFTAFSFLNKTKGVSDWWHWGLKMLSKQKKLKIKGGVKLQPPPATFPRQRKKQDTWEWCKYHLDRRMRTFNFYRAWSHQLIAGLVHSVVFFCLFVRVLCIFTNPYAGKFIRTFLTLVPTLSHTMKTHADWHWNEVGVPADSSGHYWSDWIASSTLRTVAKPFQLPGLTGIGFNVAWDLSEFLVYYLLVPAVLVLGPYFLIPKYLAREQKQFKDHWDKVGRAEMWPECGSSKGPCPCVCTQRYGSIGVDVPRRNSSLRAQAGA